MASQCWGLPPGRSLFYDLGALVRENAISYGLADGMLSGPSWFWRRRLVALLDQGPNGCRQSIRSRTNLRRVVGEPHPLDHRRHVRCLGRSVFTDLRAQEAWPCMTRIA